MSIQWHACIQFFAAHVLAEIISSCPVIIRDTATFDEGNPSRWENDPTRILHPIKQFPDSQYGIIEPMNSNIIGVRFTKVGKIYHFDTSAVPDIGVGEHVIVDTSRGRHLGEVVQIVKEAPEKPEGGWRSVERRATPRDLLLLQSWQSKQTEAMINCRARASELRLAGVKIVTAEYNYDGSRLAFLFSTESEEKVDLKSLKKDMHDLYPNVHIEMRQIGPRDVAKIIGGMGACGLETRCCSQFLTDFSPISIKMAKDQGISLTPNEITGMCGRLRCCLIYEYEQYVAARKELPKRNKRVVTPKGEGKVIDVLPMTNKVMVLIEGEEGKRFTETFEREDLQPWDELEALRRKSQAPCDRHEGGGCTCGKAPRNKNQN
jgi:cell fate regulator YaaT (PSP1 superfamily)